MTQPWPAWETKGEFTRVHDAHAAGEPAQLRQLLELAGVPLDELWPTVYSARVCAMAVQAGHAFVHHERRVWTPLPPTLAPDATSANEGAVDGPAWQAGVLEIPKYFGAFLDAPLAVYDPNHRHKWRSHELLHRRVGFSWAPDMTPFEAYVSARLSELLPIVHWYGLDEIGRRRCEKHQGKLLRREFCFDCEALRRPYWENRVKEASAESWLDEAKNHLEDELVAIHREIETGRAVATPRPGLDASSDATAYLRGHWSRLTAWSFGSWVELFGVAGRDYESTVTAMLVRVETMGEQLFSGVIDIDPDAAKLQRERQRLRDLGYRCLCALEWNEDEEVEDLLWPHLEALGDAAARLGRGESVAELGELERQLWSAWGRVRDVFPPGLVDGLRETGACFGGARAGDLALEQLAEGLRSALPDTGGDIEAAGLAAFAHSEAFAQPGGIASRFVAFAGDQLPEAICLETWLRERPLRDEEGEVFGVLPEDSLDIGSLRPNATLRRGRFGADAIEAVLGWRPDAPEAELAAIWRRGEPRVIECDADIVACLDALVAGDEEALASNPALAGLLEASFVYYLPPAR